MRDPDSEIDIIGTAPEVVLVLAPLADGMIGIAARADAGRRPDEDPEIIKRTKINNYYQNSKEQNIIIKQKLE